MARITYYLTDSAHLNEIEVAAGNLIFCENTKTIYLDSANGRVAYESITVFETELERYEYVDPQVGFYYVEETKVLWRFTGVKWESITEPPTNNVIFIPKSELPVEGEFAVLYVCDKEFLIWNPDTHQYEGMNAESVWHEV